MHESFWWWQCGDRYMISLFPHLHTHFPPFSPSLISLMVSVDVKHHAYFCFICRTLSGRVVSHVWFRPWILMWLSSWLGNSATYAVHAQQQTYRWVSCREDLIHLLSHQCHLRGSWGMKIHGLVHLPKFYRLRYGLFFRKGKGSALEACVILK